MTVTAKDLRFNISMLFDVLGKGEEVTITYRGRPKAKLIPTKDANEAKEDFAFGMWSDKEEDVDSLVRSMRKGRNFAV